MLFGDREVAHLNDLFNPKTPASQTPNSEIGTTTDRKWRRTSPTQSFLKSRRSSATSNIISDWTFNNQRTNSTGDSISLGNPVFSLPLQDSDLVIGGSGHIHSPVSSVSIRIAEPKTKCGKICSYIHSFYEKSHVKRLFPILILISYSFLGGALLYWVEEPYERDLLASKQSYIEQQKLDILEKIMESRMLHYMKEDPLPDCSPFLRDYDYVWRKKILMEELTNENFTSVKDSILDFTNDVYNYVLSLYYLSDHHHQKNQYDASRSNASSIIGRIENVELQIKYLAMRCCELVLMSEDRNITEYRFNESLRKFESDANLESTVPKQWTFLNAMFVATTTYTTIGYGNIVPDTKTGKIIAILYAIVGIPLVLMILHKLGRVFLALLQALWDLILRLCVKQPDVLKKKSQIVLDTSAGRESYNIPVALAIGVTFAWMFSCAGIFMLIEKDWDFFKAFYFYFVSVTTIGFGDVVPSSDANVFLVFFFIIMGLSLFSMCINVVQIQLERLFEELLLQMMEEYQTAQISDGPMPEVPPDIKKGADLVNMWNIWRQRRKIQQQKRKSQTNNTKEQQPSTTNTPVSRFNTNKYLASFMGQKRRLTLISEWEKRAKMRCAWTQSDTLRTRTIATQTDANVSASELDQSTATDIDNDIIQERRKNRKHTGTMPQIPETSSTTSSNSSLFSKSTKDKSSGSKRKLLQLLGSSSFDDKSHNNNCISEALSPCFSDPALVTTKESATSPPSSHTTTYYTASTGGSLSSTTEGKFNNELALEGLEVGPEGGWTFIQSQQTGRERNRRGSLPRGLVPNMYINRASKVGRDELRELMREIDLRIIDCRTIANQVTPRGMKSALLSGGQIIVPTALPTVNNEPRDRYAESSVASGTIASSNNNTLSDRKTSTSRDWV